MLWNFFPTSTAARQSHLSISLSISLSLTLSLKLDPCDGPKRQTGVLEVKFILIFSTFLSLSLPASSPIFLTLCLSVFFSPCVSLSLFLPLPCSLSLPLSRTLSPSLYISFSFSISISISLSLSLSLSFSFIFLASYRSCYNATVFSLLSHTYKSEEAAINFKSFRSITLHENTWTTRNKYCTQI